MHEDVSRFQTEKTFFRSNTVSTLCRNGEAVFELPQGYVPNISTAVPIQHQQEKRYVKKPPNAFMLYRHEQRHNVVLEYNITDSAVVNKILGAKGKNRKRKDNNQAEKEPAAVSKRAKKSCGPFSGPYMTQPHMTQPYMTQPHMTQPHMMQPHMTQPYMTQPHMTQPHMNQAYMTQPHMTQPHKTQAYITQPHMMQPHMTQPYMTQPHMTPPHKTQAYITQPHMTQSHMTPPHENQPHMTQPDMDTFFTSNTVSTLCRNGEAVFELPQGYVPNISTAVPIQHQQEKRYVKKPPNAFMRYRHEQRHNVVLEYNITDSAVVNKILGAKGKNRKRKDNNQAETEPAAVSKRAKKSCGPFSGPYMTQPYMTQPYMTQPHMMQPHMTQPHKTQAYITQPHMTQPYMTQPHMTQPHMPQPHKTQAYITQPHMTQPYMTQPHMTQPYMTQPHMTQPYMTQPHMTPPHKTQAYITQPHMTQPHMTPPHENQPHMTQPDMDTFFTSNTVSTLCRNGEAVFELPQGYVPNISTAVPIQHQQEKRYVKKPPNAFMRYRHEQRHNVVLEYNITDSAVVNKILGAKWKSLSKEQQARYYERAAMEKLFHAQQHPDWSAKDNYGKNRKRKDNIQAETEPAAVSKRAKKSCGPFSGPYMTQPYMTQPYMTQPHMMQPHMTQPHKTQAYITQPHMTQPYMTQPHMTQPHMNQAYMTQPHMPQPHKTQAYITQPHMMQPHMTQPYMTQPHMTPPHKTQAYITQPHMTQPHMTPPHENQPHMTQPDMDTFFTSNTVSTLCRNGEAVFELPQGYVPNISTAVPIQHQQEKRYVKKPPNAFMRYRHEQRHNVVLEYNITDSAVVNKILGAKWKSLSKEQQARYYERAAMEKLFHAQQHPDWSAKDNYTFFTSNTVSTLCRNGEAVFELPQGYVPNISTAVPIQHQQEKSYVKKPPNAFMRYRHEQRHNVVLEYNITDSAVVNKILGAKWKSLSKEQQARYYERAAMEKLFHAQQHPEWSAKDNYTFFRSNTVSTLCRNGEAVFELSQGYVPNISTAVSIQHQQEKRYVKKPPNAFMRYRHEQRHNVVLEYNITDSAVVNKILGAKWKSLSKEQQARYYERAAMEKLFHAQQHPEWSAKDNYGKNRKRKDNNQAETEPAAVSKRAKKTCGPFSGPYMTQPYMTQPYMTQPHMTQPHMSQPHKTQAYITQPHMSQPHMTQPYMTQPHMSQLHMTQPHMNQAYMTQSHMTQPHINYAHMTQPHMSQPHMPQPHKTQAYITQPHMSQPHMTPPHETQPHMSQPDIDAEIMDILQEEDIQLN
ncbi:hypothetical protein PAMA_016998 [Pampus argenteus]